MNQPIYLDNNATTQILPDVAKAILDYQLENFANPASQHKLGRKARKEITDLQNRIVQILGGRHAGMNQDRLIFTSGGTEANNLAVFGLAGPPPARILISSVEHPSLVMTPEPLRKLGYEVELINVDHNGVCDLNHLDELLRKPTRLVCVMFANNETGTIQPVDEITELCRSADALFHCDAVQAVAKTPVSIIDTDFDSLAFTAHKFHGPKGIGGLLVKEHLELSPILFGGFQQMGIRPGTESVELVLGMLTAFDFWQTSDADRATRICELRDKLEAKLLEELPDIKIHAKDVSRLPHTSNISFIGIDRQSFIMAADMANLAVSTGSACSSGSSEPSHVLTAMSCPEDQISSSIRISLSAQTTSDEVQIAADRICKIYKNLRRPK